MAALYEFAWQVLFQNHVRKGCVSLSAHGTRAGTKGCVSWNTSASRIRESKPRTAPDRVLFRARGNASRNPFWPPPQPLQSSLKGFKSNRVRAPNPQRPAQYPPFCSCKKEILALPPPLLRPLSPSHHAIHLHRQTSAYKIPHRLKRCRAA